MKNVKHHIKLKMTTNKTYTNVSAEKILYLGAYEIGTLSDKTNPNL